MRFRCITAHEGGGDLKVAVTFAIPGIETGVELFSEHIDSVFAQKNQNCYDDNESFHFSSVFILSVQSHGNENDGLFANRFTTSSISTDDEGGSSTVKYLPLTATVLITEIFFTVRAS